MSRPMLSLTCLLALTTAACAGELAAALDKVHDKVVALHDKALDTKAELLTKLAEGAESKKIEPSAAALMYPDCIATPSEFEAVFKSGVGLRNRCVSRDLIGRVGQGDDAAQAIDGGAPSTGGAFIFVSGNDGLEKDLRIAFPDVVGNFVPSHTNPLDGPAFQGLLDISNGQAQLEQIGFPAQFADINATYSFTVFSAVAVRRAVQKGAAPGPNTVGENFGPLSPSWANVVDVYNYAFGKCCGVAIPPAVTQILQTTTFSNLTHCPTECDYVDTRFPGTSSVPVVNLPRLEGGACPPSNATFNQTSPSFFEADSPLCAKVFKDANTAFFNVYGGKDPDCAANKLAAGRLLGTSLAAAGGDALAQAQIVRAFALQGCSGDLNPLNTGNGFTATGFGGLFAQTASEFIVAPFKLSDLPASAFRTIVYCISGKPPVGGSCAAGNV